MTNQINECLKEVLDEAFFELRTGLAGEVLRDWIYERNQGRNIFFVATEEEGSKRLSEV